ncbi:MAG: DUF4489 domain-containing protein [Clostridium sp.]|uniref:DUF4489 domain-containing protein n=1 Tax=Clostridium sp. TaxID=1506 RepID=UPI003D6CCB5F
MNSMSKGFHDEKECGCRREEGTKVLLKCKVGNPAIVTVTGAAIPAAAVTTQLAKVVLNVEHFHDPCIKFEFATNLVATVGTAIVDVSFQLYKLCKGETIPEAIGNPWVYPVPGVLTDIISFIVCDCGCDNDCDCYNDCCSYYVAAITSTTDIVTADSTTLVFNNSTLSALVIENKKSC